ncbi:MAG: hypothetical protein Kow0075_14480 [Salibacteraceae bacterium]
MHLGLEKTGSTFLHERVFTKLSGIRYHRKSRFRYFEQIVDLAPTENHLFRFETDREFFNVVDRIVAHRPDAFVFFVLRRHDSWLKSKYNYHIRKHGFKSLREFFDMDNDMGEWKKSEMLLKPKIDYALQKFPGRVLLLNYDELRSDRRKFIGHILTFTGAELNDFKGLDKPSKPAFSLKQNRILMAFNRAYPYKHLGSRSRFLNRLWYKYREFLLHTVAFLAQFVPSALVSKDPIIDEEYLNRVKDFYRDDWQYALDKIAETLLVLSQNKSANHAINA